MSALLDPPVIPIEINPIVEAAEGTIAILEEHGWSTTGRGPDSRLCLIQAIAIEARARAHPHTHPLSDSQLYHALTARLGNIPTWNDAHTEEEVFALLRQVIEEAR